MDLALGAAVKGLFARRSVAIRAAGIALALLGFFLPSRLAAESRPPDSFRLPNGLKTIVQRDPSSPLVALQIWVEAGAADEQANEAGVAHVLEHILFRGSSEDGSGKIAGEIENLGGRINGYTSHDRTVYHVILPASQFRRGLSLLARLMEIPALGQAELEKEIRVVLEEWKQGQDNPRSRVSRELFKTAYRDHPYGRPIIGTPQTLRGITWETLRRFYQRWYTADNMTLVVVGDVTVDEVKKEAAESFGSLSQGSQASREASDGPVQGEPRVTIIRAPVQQAHLMIGFPIPTATAPEVPGLDFLAFVLGRGESSRLAQKIKITTGLVNSISSSTFTPKGPGLFFIQAQLESEKTMDAVKAILTEVFRLRVEEVAPSEFNRAYVNFVRTFVESRETVQGQANQFGRFQALYGDPGQEASYLEAIRSLDAHKIRRLAQKYFHTDRLALALVFPERADAAPDPQEILSSSRALEPTAQAPVATREDGVLKATLSNGLRIRILEDRRLPLVAMHAGAIGGLLLEDTANNGIHNFIATMLTQGNPRLTSTQLVHEVEQLGGSLSASSGNHTISLRGTFPSQHLEKGLEIFLDTLLNPTFPETELEQKRREILLRIKNRDERSRSQAFRVFYQTLLRAHPYRLHPTGEQETVRRFRREDLATHYQQLISPERIVLSVVGDVDAEALFGRLYRRLSALPPRSPALAPPSAEDALPEQRVKKKTAKFNQAQIVLGYPAPVKGHSDYFALEVLEVILSRIGGRLFVELRDKQGLAYSVGAFSLSDPFQGAFGIYAATDPGNIETMREGILRELGRLHEEACADQELIRAKNYLIGSYLIARQTNAAKAADLTENALLGFGTGFGERYREGIEKVTAGDILRVARRYLPLDRYVLAIVGP